MKNFLSTIIVFLSFNAISQNVYTIPQYKKVLECNYFGTSESCAFSEFVWHGDTLIENETYTKVSYEKELFAMVREDTIVDSLYVINLEGQQFKAPIISDLSLGDTITLYSWHYKLMWDWGEWNNMYSKEKINNIEQININGRLRNKYSLTTVENTGAPSGADLTFIEGVGISHWMYLSGTTNIECFYEKNQLGINKYNGDPSVPPCNSTDVYVGTNHLLEQKIKVYPNPTQGTLLLDAEFSTQVQIYSITGTLLSTENHTPISSIDLSNYSTGIYFIAFTYGDQSIIKRIVKQ